MESRDRHYRRDSYIEGNVVRQRESVPGRSVQPAEKQENSCIRSV